MDITQSQIPSDSGNTQQNLFNSVAVLMILGTNKYVNKQDATHLIDTLQKYYNITIDWSGPNYCGLTLNWDSRNKHADISMPCYIKKLLNCQRAK